MGKRDNRDMMSIWSKINDFVNPTASMHREIQANLDGAHRNLLTIQRALEDRISVTEPMPTHCDDCIDGWHYLRALGAMGPGSSFETTGGDVKIVVAQIENDTVTLETFFRCPVVQG